MLDLAVFCQLVLAGVFVVSGVTKLLDFTATMESVTAFGVPERHAGWLSRALPAAELVVAALLVTQPAGRAGAAVALLLLVVFTAAVVESLRRGRRPECHCFGRLGSSDISGRTVARNLVLGLMTGPSLLNQPVDWSTYSSNRSGVPIAVTVCSAIVAAAGIVAAEAAAGRRGAARRQKRMGDQLVADLGGGEISRGAAPSFTLPTITGVSVSLHDLLDPERPLLLTFLSPGCGPCRRLRPLVTRWGEVFADRLRIAVVVTGSAASNRSSFGDSALPVLLDGERSVADSYGVPSRPAAVLISPGGDLVGPVAVGDLSVRALVNRSISAALPQPAEMPAGALTVASTPGPRPTVTAHHSDDATVVVTDEVNGASAALDRTAALVWQCLDGRSPLGDIARDIADGYGVPQDMVQGEVLRLVRHLGALGFLRGVAADEGARPAAESPAEPVPV